MCDGFELTLPLSCLIELILVPISVVKESHCLCIGHVFHESKNTDMLIVLPEVFQQSLISWLRYWLWNDLCEVSRIELRGGWMLPQ